MSTKIEFSAKLLQTLHRIHRQREDLESELERGPRQIKAGEAMVQAVQAKLDEARESLKQAKMSSDQRQLQLKSREGKIEELKAKLNTAASNREFDLLKEQIAADEQANAVLSDEILEGFESLDAMEAGIKEVEQELSKTQDEHKTRITTIEARLNEVRDNLGHVRSELETAETEIPTAAKSEYTRMTTTKGQEALAPVEEDCCSGCHTVLTTQTIDRLRLSQLVRCPSCNAFLYMPEDNRVT